MLQVGDYVVSSANGICKIEEEVEQNWSGKKKTYFMLLPVKEKGTKLYIPIDTAEQRIRKAMDYDEAEDFIDSLGSVLELKIENDKLRENEYKQAVYSGEPSRIASVIKTIYVRMQKRLVQGKKTTAIDERYLKTAVHMLHSELAYALGCEEEEVEGIIMESLGSE